MRSMTDEGGPAKRDGLEPRRRKPSRLRATSPHPTSLREVTFSRKGRRAAPFKSIDANHLGLEKMTRLVQEDATTAG